MAKSKAYWAARAAKREQEAYLRGSALSQRLFREYQRSTRELMQSISAFYGRYGDKYGLSYQEAVKRLSRKEAREWRASLGDYVTQIKEAADPKRRKELTAALDALSANSQISRLEAVLADSAFQMEGLYERCQEELRQELGALYGESFAGKCVDLQERLGRAIPDAYLTPSLIADAVSYPWSGAMFSQRLWNNKNALVFSLRETMTQGLIQGKGLAAVSTELATKMGQSYKAAERLVRTESNHLHNRADLAAYEAAGVEWYQYMATVDERTCQSCAALDGKHFLVKEALPGTNFPPMHPNDRCTTVEYDQEEENPGSAGSIPKNTGRKVEYDPDASYEIRVLEWDEATNQGVSKACEEVARLGGTDGKEHLILFDRSTGKRVYREDGEEGAVGGPEFWKALEAVPDGAGIFIHNHPTDGFLSETDMRTLLTTKQLGAMVATRNDGVQYLVLKDAARGKPFTTNFDDLYPEEIQTLTEQIRSGKITAGERTFYREELIVNNLIRDYTKGLMEFDGRKG